MKKKKASEVIDELAKLAGYLKEISCEECRYEGKPSYDGSCPKCGSLGGIKPKEPISQKPNEYSKELNTKEFFDALSNCVGEINPYM